MTSDIVHPKRIVPLNGETEREDAKSVLFWMQTFQRAEGNPNTFTSVLQCLGEHGRPWGERPVTRAVRSISEPRDVTQR